jgi:glycosyltransferase involved in cell wall biosynthesis
LIQYEGLDELPFKIIVLKRYIKKDPTIISRLKEIIRLFNPDIIHTWGGMASVYAIPLGKLMGKRTVNGMVTNSTKFSVFSENWNRSKLTFPFSDVILANSYAGLNSYNVKKSKGVVVYNGFNADRLNLIKSQKEIKEKFKLESPFIIGMVGALHDRKDYKTFILAAKYILQKRNDVIFLIVGDGPNAEKCKELAGEDLGKGIIFLGNQKDVESIVNVFHIGVLTTNQTIHGEGISNAIMEYMALGKCVIATNGGGNLEIIKNEITGYLINQSAEMELTNAIDFLLNNPQKLKEMGNEGKKRIKEVFSYEQMINGTLNVYLRLLNIN